jgi:hypothetical protein
LSAPDRVRGWLGPVGLVVALALGVRAAVGIQEEIVFNDGPEFIRYATGSLARFIRSRAS